MRVARFLFVPLLLTMLATAGCRSTPKVRFYDGFDGYHRPVTTRSNEAQTWFDQGMALLYGFNHDEAVRSFREAARLDPECVMAWWGIAYANGADINNQQMSADEAREAWTASREALRLVETGVRVHAVEAALAQAVGKRYAWPAPEDRGTIDRTYANAMLDVWRTHPEDPDVGAFYAESLMNLQPWDLWTSDGEPKGRVLEIVATLEEVLRLQPDHPGACHYYIHTVEASPDPARAVAAAKVLEERIPGSGHLVHMPSHIYVRVGRYADASDVNERAIAADRAYFGAGGVPGFYLLYFSHNLHMLAFAAMMEGRYATAMEAARTLEREIPQSFLREATGFVDGIMATPYHVLVRFGRWQDVLREPEPEDYRLLSRTQRHYARGLALSALGRTGEARRELEAFDALAATVPEEWVVGNNSSGEVLAIARGMLSAELLWREGRRHEAFEAMRATALLEDELTYDEPPGWMQPVRHAFGALLMAADRHAEAEAVYREDLVRHPENAWSLLGLEQSLVAQNKTATEAADARGAAWRRADVNPTSSCYCEPGR